MTMSSFCQARGLRAALAAACMALSLAGGPGSAWAADTAAAPAPTAPARINNIVLVHGAFVDASSWNQVIVRLQAKGYEVSAVQNPLTSLHDDVVATRRVLARQHGPTLLVGYSWGGMPITEAAAGDAQVAGLVYIAALAPEVGESARQLLDKFPDQATMPGQKSVQIDADGLYWIERSGYHFALAHDSDPALTRVLAVSQMPMPTQAFEEAAAQAAWHDKPSWYAVSSQDKIVSPTLQRWLAARMHATTIDIPSGHASILSHPDTVADLIEQAAAQALHRNDKPSSQPLAAR